MCRASGCSADIKEIQRPDISKSVQNYLNLDTRITREKETFCKHIQNNACGFSQAGFGAYKCQ